MGEVVELRRHVPGLASSARTRSDAGAVELKDLIGAILEVRANRRAVFGASFFGEPSWDMLLELYDAHFKGRRECVSSLCIASGVPSTTALRWLGNLVEEGWITRVPDPKDARRTFVELTERGVEAMSKVFAGTQLVGAARS
jgi:DNA-binding MarR family transcriptional regulator